MKNIKLKVASVAICVVLTSAVVLSIRGFSYFANVIEDYRGYSYEAKIAANYDWIGPKTGEIIDYNFLATASGSTLSQLPKNDLILLTVIDPECAACRQTREQFRFLRENLSETRIDYFVVCFSPKVSPSELSEYVKSLDVNTESFSWTKGLDTVLPSITAIAYPTHILLDSKGSVIKSFPGTSNEKRIRDRMVRQVFREVIAEKDRRN